LHLSFQDKIHQRAVGISKESLVEPFTQRTPPAYCAPPLAIPIDERSLAENCINLPLWVGEVLCIAFECRGSLNLSRLRHDNSMRNSQAKCGNRSSPIIPAHSTTQTTKAASSTCLNNGLIFYATDFAPPILMIPHSRVFRPLAKDTGTVLPPRSPARCTSQPRNVISFISFMSVA
jgi:hypothetical protein